MNRLILPYQESKGSSVGGHIRLPGSKYIANRLLPMTALAQSKSRLTNCVNNNDINTAIKGLSMLGYQFDQQLDSIVISPRLVAITQPVELYTAHSGTFSRFVTAISALEEYPVTINCSSKMATRPMIELFQALEELKVKIESPNQCLPAVITGSIHGSSCQIDASRSSQYLSSLLIIAPLLNREFKIEVSGEIVSRAYVDMTLRLMLLLGVEVIEEDNTFTIAAGQSYQGIDYAIPCDPVSSTYFMGAAAISNSEITIEGFDFDSVQGESKFYLVLESMGVDIKSNNDELTICGTGELNGVTVDMGDMPDAVQTLAAVACFAKGETRINNIAHLAYKESNRIEDTANEIRKTGIQVETGSDYLVIHGGQPHAAEINTHEDHRMAMSMALLGINTQGIKVLNAEVVEKSFPTYWDCLAQVGINNLIEEEK